MDHGILIGGLLSLATLISFAKGAAGLGLVIFVHELGHFLVAKACGVKCEKFYVGFDAPITIFGIALPRTLFKKQWGETEYGIGVIPLGGYVKMLGQDDNPSNAAAEAARIKAEGGHLDPRSYPAKSVPQRMAIISAGVIFNLIFGILFAAGAYKMGVRYTPTVVGGTTGVGDPAWLAGIEPGDRIVSLTADAPDNPHLRFRDDLRVHMLTIDEGDSIAMRVQGPNGQVREVPITPNAGYQKQTRSPTIGIWMANTPTIRGLVKGSVAEQAGVQLGDTIQAVSVDGTRREIDPDGIAVDLQQVFANAANKPITLHVTRTDPKTETESSHDLTLEVSYAKRFGLELAMGPVVCIQKNSVAEKAGVRSGDVMTQINGQPIGDPMTLATRLLAFANQSIELTVLRENTPVQLTVTPTEPRVETPSRRRNGPLGLDALGIGFVVYPTVMNVIPDSPAAQQGMQPGDVLKSVKLDMPFQPVPAEKRMPWLLGKWQDFRKQRNNARLLEAYELDKPVPVDQQNSNWPYVIDTVQSIDDRFEVTVQYDRDSVERVATMNPAKSSTMVNSRRGILLKGYEETRVAQNWSEALSLGGQEVMAGMRQVLIVLRRIGSNYKDLGGPLTIAAVATMQADQGLAQLLIFLTLLSANLAVLNFLPIPVLDGGHMVFLAYEGIVGKPVNERVQMSLTLLGFSFLMCLMLFVFGLDLTRFLG